MVVAKIVALILALGLYFGLFVFGPWYADLRVQTVLLVLLLGIHVQRHGLAATRTALGVILPFVLSLMAFGTLFQWLELLDRTDWILDSLLKALVFPNSFLAVKLALHAITFRDIVALPLPVDLGHGCIVLKAVLEKGTPLLHRHRFFMDLCPHFDGRRWARLHRLAGVIVAAYIGLYRETEKTQALLTHRTSCTRKTE